MFSTLTLFGLLVTYGPLFSFGFLSESGALTWIGFLLCDGSLTLHGLFPRLDITYNYKPKRLIRSCSSR